MITAAIDFLYYEFCVNFLGCLSAPWVRLSFSEPVRFLLPAIILSTLALILLRDKRTPPTERNIRATKIRTYIVANAAPFVLLVGLMVLRHQATIVLGHEPRFLLDDPKGIGDTDQAYQMLFGMMEYVADVAIWLVYTALGLCWHLRRSLTRLDAILLPLTSYLSWKLLFISPVMQWWLD